MAVLHFTTKRDSTGILKITNQFSLGEAEVLRLTDSNLMSFKAKFLYWTYKRKSEESFDVGRFSVAGVEGVGFKGFKAKQSPEAESGTQLPTSEQTQSYNPSMEGCQLPSELQNRFLPESLRRTTKKKGS